ncbi:hypothetical protein CPB84DRAFT_1762904 [Gymnopilus junonius]|uniref:Uncharacterized protein n=1 Tax=Gymnopilus junonius TaxID=109634 RepID=A0A9P5P1A4_GYMJU|nr:hypothetical protein CPB84DRAFT_1762904 [Gymnopilus junonius]
MPRPSSWIVLILLGYTSPSKPQIDVAIRSNALCFTDIIRHPLFVLHLEANTLQRVFMLGMNVHACASLATIGSNFPAGPTLHSHLLPEISYKMASGWVFSLHLSPPMIIHLYFKPNFCDVSLLFIASQLRKALKNPMQNDFALSDHALPEGLRPRKLLRR